MHHKPIANATLALAVLLLVAMAAACNGSGPPRATAETDGAASPLARSEGVNPAAASSDSAPTGMVRIPRGDFRLGESGGAEPGTPTQVAGFWMDRTEVTVQQYAACVAAGRCTPPRDRWTTCNWPRRDQRGRHPINCVDWTQADAYCAWAGKRLPSEQEWEFAARGTDGRLYPWGEAVPDRLACLKRSTAKQGRTDEAGTCPVNRFPGDASPFGVLGMAGNVKEWTASVETLPGKVEARVIRGGGWSVDALNLVPALKVVERESLKPSEFASDLGFRCAAAKPVPPSAGGAS